MLFQLIWYMLELKIEKIKMIKNVGLLSLVKDSHHTVQQLNEDCVMSFETCGDECKCTTNNECLKEKSERCQLI